MNFSRRLATTTNRVRVRIRLTLPQLRFRSGSPSFSFFDRNFRFAARRPCSRPEEILFYAALYWWLFPSLFSRAAPPAKKKKGCAARRERSVRMRAAGQGRHATSSALLGIPFYFTLLYCYLRKRIRYFCGFRARAARARRRQCGRAPARPPPRPPTPGAWRGVASA